MEKVNIMTNLRNHFGLGTEFSRLLEGLFMQDRYARTRVVQKSETAVRSLHHSLRPQHLMKVSRALLNHACGPNQKESTAAWRVTSKEESWFACDLVISAARMGGTVQRGV